MKVAIYSDEILCNMIQLGGKQRNVALKHLYQDSALKTSVFKALQRMGAQENDILDTYQDAFIILDKNIRRKKFLGQSSLKTYFLSIAKWHQLSKLRKMKKTHLQEDLSEFELYEQEQQENLYSTEKSKSIVRSLISQMGESCKYFLMLYMQNIPMKEIAEQNNMNTQSAKNAVFRCRNKLRQLILESKELSSALNISRS